MYFISYLFVIAINFSLIAAQNKTNTTIKQQDPNRRMFLYVFCIINYRNNFIMSYMCFFILLALKY